MTFLDCVSWFSPLDTEVSEIISKSPVGKWTELTICTQNSWNILFTSEPGLRILKTCKVKQCSKLHAQGFPIGRSLWRTVVKGKWESSGGGTEDAD